MRWPAGQCRCGEVNGQVVRGAGTDEVRWLNQRALRGGGSGEQGLVINAGRHAGEKSDWSVSEVITW